mgnify:FL=1
MRKISSIGLRRRKAEHALQRIANQLLQISNQSKPQEKQYLEIIFLNDQEMKKLKKKFLKQEGAHDVLAFPEPPNFPHPEKKGRKLGEVYLNSRFLNQFDQLVFLMVHGLLHLLGFTHNHKSDTIRMEQAERQLMEKIILPLR